MSYSRSVYNRNTAYADIRSRTAPPRPRASEVQAYNRVSEPRRPNVPFRPSVPAAQSSTVRPYPDARSYPRQTAGQKPYYQQAPRQQDRAYPPSRQSVDNKASLYGGSREQERGRRYSGTAAMPNSEWLQEKRQLDSEKQALAREREKLARDREKRAEELRREREARQQQEQREQERREQERREREKERRQRELERYRREAAAFQQNRRLEETRRAMPSERRPVRESDRPLGRRPRPFQPHADTRSRPFQPHADTRRPPMRSSREDYERRPQPLTRTAAPRFSGDRKSDFVGREPLRGAGREPVESARRPPRGKGGSRPGGDEGIRQRRPPIAQPRRNVPPARVEAYDARQERDRALERERARLRQLREEESSMRERPLKDRGPAYHRSAVALALQRQRQRAQRTQPAKIEADGTLRRAPVAVQRQERIVSADSATAAKARHVVRRKAEGPLEKPCKTLVERIATFLRHSFKATTSEGEQPSGPQVTLEMIKDKMGLRLPLKSLDNMLQGSFNERSVVVVDGYYYSNLVNPSAYASYPAYPSMSALVGG